jgi:hypothetical protein
LPENKYGLSASHTGMQSVYLGRVIRLRIS